MDRRPVVILLDSSQLGGIETHVYHLARALDQFGIPAQIWFSQQHTNQHPLEPRFKAEHIEYRFLAGSLSNLISELQATNPLVLHTHGYKAGIFGRLAAKMSKTPVVSTFHNGDPGEGIVRLYTWLDRITSTLSLNIAVSNEIAERFKHHPVQINNFIDIPQEKQKTGKAVAFVGRLSHEKGPDQFLQLAKHQPDMIFRLYGSGPMEPSLIQQKTDNIEFMGQVSGMNNQWHEISLLCITSRHEGLPMVALEAMAHGIPVVSFSLGALPMLIDQGMNGWIIPEGSIQKMSDSLSLWQTLPENDRQHIRSQCIKTVRDEYSYQAVLPKVLSIYQQACERTGQPWPKIMPANKSTAVSVAGE